MLGGGQILLCFYLFIYFIPKKKNSDVSTLQTLLHNLEHVAVTHTVFKLRQSGIYGWLKRTNRNIEQEGENKEES